MNEPSIRVLLIEDEPQIRRFVKTALENQGWQVYTCERLAEAHNEAASRLPELVILDLGLPDGDGGHFIRDFRQWSTAPIIVLSARTHEAQKVAALDLGADDYVTKPFGLPEFLARIRANLRRNQSVQPNRDSRFRFGTIEVDFSARTVTRDGESIHLTPIEYRLLSHLIANAGRVVTQKHLLREVWGPNSADKAHYLRVYMGHLRQKLEYDPAQPHYLLTETGVGYRLLVP